MNILLIEIMNKNLKPVNKKPLYLKITPSNLSSTNISRKFYQFKNNSNKIIRIDSMSDLAKRYHNLANPNIVIKLGKKLFQEIQTNYNICVPSKIIVEKNKKNEKLVYIITDKINGTSLEKTKKTKKFLKELESLYVSISKYYLDKLNNKEAHLADLNNPSQYIYGTKNGEKIPKIYLVDTDLYLNKGDVALLHNVKWLIRHMPKKFNKAIKNIKKIIKTPLSKNLSSSEIIMANKEIEESLNLLNKKSKDSIKNDNIGFIPTPLV